ncbi:S-adenosylmethionine:tRNA ribosyltransferase-isomerase [hydrothermal vent metagenome]|uniref:S-adenosylmethionine:tRNA ribosyltransferase-isomerase n=1 Tax=hydrothermal vent metagenome TaxID=652676 RepID=A0A1W1EI11_9ZZZZ
MSIELLTNSYDYTLPNELIATKPIYPRDSAKLLVYNRKSDTITHTIFKNIMDYIPNDCDIFLNDTKVIKARIYGKKLSGGKLEFLLNKPLDDNRYLVMIRGRVKKGTVVYFDNNLTAEVITLNDDGSREVIFKQNEKIIRFEELIIILDDIGHIPLPPYIQREDDRADIEDYQTLFASNAGAVAAPTASLHFTDELFKKFSDKYNIHKITLHVGSGTFKPVEADNILEHPMHSEYYNIPSSTQTVLDGKRKVFAVGTTVTRTIEYYARGNSSSGECDLFLNPYNKPIKVDYLLTNFHLPKSTLIMLVSSFIGRKKTLELYHEAIDKGYRFYSYGDAMIII